MKLLIDKGADPNLVNENGETALHVAVSRGDALVRFLAENGTRLDIKDKFGRTPLDVAMGVPGGGGGVAAVADAVARRRLAGTVRESTAALLKELMKVPWMGRALFVVLVCSVRLLVWQFVSNDRHRRHRVSRARGSVIRR